MASGSRAEMADNLPSDPPDCESKAFLRKLGITGIKAKDVIWTADLIRRGVAIYASYTEESAEEFLESVGQELEDWAEQLTRTVRRLEADAAGVIWHLDSQASWSRVARMFTTDGRDERIAKYERHLHNLLTSTLHELERLQARRAGELVVPPVVPDVTVSVESPTL